MGINREFIDELEGNVATLQPPADYISPPEPPKKQYQSRVNRDYVDSLLASETIEVQENKAKAVEPQRAVLPKPVFPKGTT